jgi:hypothetical protein
MQKQGKPVPWSQEDAVRVHQAIIEAFRHPEPFKPGDLIQSKRHFISWDGHSPAPAAVLSVLAVHPDLGAVTGDSIDKGIPGITFADIDPSKELVHTYQSQSWHFEPYTGPMPPDAH